MPSLDQATQDLAFQAHLLLNDLDGLAFVAAVDSSTDAPPGAKIVTCDDAVSVDTMGGRHPPNLQNDLDAP
ncbi:hypothetical protein S101447_01110 [Acetobacter ascendens]|uniref:Uncharacterized protein n=1 Tax=Acetobacter ascendens TaxID=481146 RepID=A0A1Y0V3E9_9PROT|nr:hypothetical protein S101447_01110 [Acetobacter ascendens]